MATAKGGWLPVATGIVTTGLAIWVAVVVVGPQPAETSAAETAPVEDTVPTTTGAAAAPPETVVITTPPPEIDGLSESIARVLSTNGFASSLTADDIAAQLPGSVYRTLVDQGVVLSVATENPGQ